MHSGRRLLVRKLLLVTLMIKSTNWSVFSLYSQLNGAIKVIAEFRELLSGEV